MNFYRALNGLPPVTMDATTNGKALAAALRDRAVLVRHFSAPRIADYLRITIGSQPELAKLTGALADIFG